MNLKAELRPVNKGSVLGSGKIIFDGKFSINIAVMKKKDGGAFVKFPSHQGPDKDGGTKWYNDVWFDDKEFLNEINDVVLSEFDNVQSGTSHTPAKATASTTPKKPIAQKTKAEEDTSIEITPNNSDEYPF